MKHLRLLVIIFLFYSDVSAQTAESLADKKIRELNALGIDTVLAYGYGCTGCVFLFDNSADCHTADYLCLVWADKKHNYIQRIDTCYLYEPVVDEMGEVIVFMNKYLPKIINESLKPPAFKVNVSGKETENTLIVNHYSYNNYIINIGSKSYPKVVRDFDLNTKVHEIEGKISTNVNYEYNQQTYLRSLHILIGKRNTALGKRLNKIKK